MSALVTIGTIIAALVGFVLVGSAFMATSAFAQGFGSGSNAIQLFAGTALLVLAFVGSAALGMARYDALHELARDH